MIAAEGCTFWVGSAFVSYDSGFDIRYSFHPGTFSPLWIGYESASFKRHIIRTVIPLVNGRNSSEAYTSCQGPWRLHFYLAVCGVLGNLSLHRYATRAASRFHDLSVS